MSPPSSPDYVFTSAENLREKKKKIHETHHFPFSAEEGVALERLIALALSDVGEHLIVHLISSAVRDPAERSVKYMS